jgi:hypothetical protein
VKKSKGKPICYHICNGRGRKEEEKEEGYEMYLFVGICTKSEKRKEAFETEVPLGKVGGTEAGSRAFCL